MAVPVCQLKPDRKKNNQPLFTHQENTMGWECKKNLWNLQAVCILRDYIKVCAFQELMVQIHVLPYLVIRVDHQFLFRDVIRNVQHFVFSIVYSQVYLVRANVDLLSYLVLSWVSAVLIMNRIYCDMIKQPNSIIQSAEFKNSTYAHIWYTIYKQ